MNPTHEIAWSISESFPLRGRVLRAGPPAPLCFLFFVFSHPPTTSNAQGRPLTERSKTLGLAAWGRAGCWPRGVSAPATASPAAASMLGRPAPARCPMLGRCPSPGPNAGSVASSATWSARPAKVPGGNPLGTAIPGPRRVRRLLARAAALRRARAPGRREGRFVYRERKGLGWRLTYVD